MTTCGKSIIISDIISKEAKKTMDKVSAYIKENWAKTFHPASELAGDVKIDHPYVSPCATDVYTEIFYWDTYFINIGLMLDGFDEQVKNNIDNISKFINTLGYMPNANYITDRSQPPFFTRMVYDFYKKSGNKSIIEDYIGTILKEYDFWQTNRKNAVGLNSFGNSGTDAEIMWNYECHHGRVCETGETTEEKMQIGRDIMAIAESGLDFNMRFKTKGSRIAAHEFSHLDLDCILYDMEIKTTELLRVLNRDEEAETFDKYAVNRKNLMNKYYLTDDGIYLDYNMKTGGHSEILSAVSLYPYSFGISSDKEGALKVLKRLELEYGLSACEKREDDLFFQWDYPCMWPAATCLAYMGLKDVGLDDDAKRIATKYVSVARKIFDETGRLWEKYDALTGKIAVTSEYETMPMMGWTAAVYRYFVESEKI